MTLYNDVRIFILTDIIFICYFIIGFIVEYGEIYEVVSYVLIILITISYVYLIPYFSLVFASNVYSLMINNEWNLRNLNLSIVIWTRNMILILIFFMFSLIKTAHIDVHHVLLHLDPFQKATLIIFLIFIVLSFVMVVYIVMQHKAVLTNTFHTIVANVTVENNETSNVPIAINQANLQDFGSVTLTPAPIKNTSKKPSNKEIVKLITQNSNKI